MKPHAWRPARRFGRLLAWSLVALAVFYGLGVAGLAVAMRQPPERFGRIMARVPKFVMPLLPFERVWMQARAGRLRPGDAAPEFALSTLDGGRRVRLADFRGVRPVVLVFGSYT
jgi:hypothetical protein